MSLFKENQFTSKYNKIMLLAFISLAVVSMGLKAVLVEAEVINNNEKRLKSVKNSAISIDNLIASSVEHLNMMQGAAEASLRVPQQEGVLMQAVLNPAKTSLNLDNVPAPYAEENVGNLTGVRTGTDAARHQELAMALELNSLFQQTKGNIPNAAWVYYTSKSGFINIYPWVASSEFQFSEDLYTHEFYSLGLPEVNPQRETFWTEAYIDEYGKGLMVTAAKPVYRAEEFLGTVAIDITLDTLNQFVSAFELEQGELMIINDRNQVIAHSSKVSSTDQQVSQFAEALPAALVGLTEVLPRTDKQKLYHYEDAQYVWFELANAPWKVIYLGPKESVILTMFSSFGTTFSALLGMLLVVLFITKRMTFQEFIFPAESLVKHISKEAANQKSLVPEVPQQWRPWFEEISKTFAENKNLIAEIKDKNDRLIELNVSLERYMPKFILVVNLEAGCGASTLGHFFINALTQNSKDKNAVFMEYPNPASAGLQEVVKETVFKHPNGYDILTSFQWSHTPEEARASLLMTRVLDKYKNIVINVAVQGEVGEFLTDIEPFLEYAKAAVVVLPNDDEKLKMARTIDDGIRAHVRQDKTKVYAVNNQVNAERVPVHWADFAVPYQAGVGLGAQAYEVPERAEAVINTLIDRIERVHQIAVFIPTTMDVDTRADTTAYVNKTMTFLGECFGGATSAEAKGVWNSESSGIVSEAVHIVSSYTTEEDLSHFMDQVIAFVRELKVELSQEAMAIEVNKKMILV